MLKPPLQNCIFIHCFTVCGGVYWVVCMQVRGQLVKVGSVLQQIGLWVLNMLL